MRSSPKDREREEGAFCPAMAGVSKRAKSSKKVAYKCKIKITRTTINGITDITAKAFQKRTKHVENPRSKCKHKYFKVLPSACAQFFGCGNLIVHLLDFLPAKDLLNLRRLNARLHNTIENTPAHLQAAFYNAEPGDRNFVASIEHQMLRPESDEEQTDQDRLLNLNKAHIMYGAPSRRVHLNRFLLNDTSIHDCEYTSVGANIRLHNSTADGAPIWADLELKFDAMTDTVIEQSSCMGMFLTQPPVMEVLVRAPLEIEYHYGHKSSWQPHSGAMLLATAGEGLRYRDLYQHLNRLNKLA